MGVEEDEGRFYSHSSQIDNCTTSGKLPHGIFQKIIETIMALPCVQQNPASRDLLIHFSEYSYTGPYDSSFNISAKTYDLESLCENFRVHLAGARVVSSEELLCHEQAFIPALGEIVGTSIG